MKIVFLQTGGTIDKDYPKSTRGYAFEISEPAVKRILENVHPAIEYEILTVLRKDSLDMTEEDRDAIRTACRESTADKIIITHGTDTMIETGRRLSDLKNKTIVITGATRPERFSNSDAAFNVGLALGAIMSVPPGVYIAMHGRVFSWDKVTRDMKTGQFIDK